MSSLSPGACVGLLSLTPGFWNVVSLEQKSVHQTLAQAGSRPGDILPVPPSEQFSLGVCSLLPRSCKHCSSHPLSSCSPVSCVWVKFWGYKQQPEPVKPHVCWCMPPTSAGNLLHSARVCPLHCSSVCAVLPPPWAGASQQLPPGPDPMHWRDLGEPQEMRLIVVFTRFNSLNPNHPQEPHPAGRTLRACSHSP